MVIGSAALRYDEYNRPRRTGSLKSDVDASTGDLRTILWQALEELKAAPPISLIDTATQQLVWGVEWRVVRHDGHWLINAVNLTRKPVTVKLQRQDTTAVNAIDLIGDDAAKSTWELSPLAPVLWRGAN